MLPTCCGSNFGANCVCAHCATQLFHTRQGSVVTVMGWGSERDTELSTLGIVVTYPIIFIDEVKH